MASTARARRRKRDDRTGLLLLTAAVGLAAAVGGAFAWISRQHPEVDPKTLCPLEGPRSVTVLLVDRTQPLSAIQQEALRLEFLRIKDAVPPGGALEIYSIGPIETGVLQPELPRLCSPGRGKGVSPLTGNPRVTERQWHERFDGPVQQLLTKLAHPGSQPTSPILESIQSVALTALAPLPEQIGQKRLIIASDMLQNTAELSQYRQETPFAEFKGTGYYRRIRPDLRGVDVEIIYVRREGPHQGARHIEFWQEYFGDAGARLSGVRALIG